MMNRITAVTVPEGGVKLKQEHVVAYVNDKCLLSGTLYVAESHLSWIKDTTSLGFCVEYPSITVHAISRDCSSFPKQCLYAVLDVSFEDESDDQQVPVTELRFVPGDAAALSVMFEAVSACQRLHPDKVSSDEGEYYNDAEEAGDDAELDLNDLPEADRILFQRSDYVNGSESTEADSLEGAVSQLSTNDSSDHTANGYDGVAMDTGGDDSQFDDAVE